MELWLRTARELYTIKQELKELEQKEETLSNQLKELSLHTTTAHDIFIFEKKYHKGSIDYASIPGIKNMNLEFYRRKETENWKLILRLKPQN